jgi:alpha-amylase
MHLALVFHNHQPVGQLPWAFEDAWRDCYAPFLDALEAHPQIKVALHYTGPLLDWLEENKPATIAQIRRLAERGQVEVLGGGYYEPILAVWPRRDQQAQIAKLAARVEQLFGAAPRGVWLAERVWEPQLAGVLCDAGAGFTFVDGTVFAEAGVAAEASLGCFNVPGGSESTPVFPINQSLRHLIPWKEADKVLAHLRALNEKAEASEIVVFADDGEKFGAWPGTFEWVFEKGWLDRFFTELEENAAWLPTILPAEYSASHQPHGAVELPAGSYAEMQEWSGGDWRNFLERYQESGDMYREALRAGEALESGAAYEDALRAQSNDAYWHGVFGGLYLRHLRQAIYAATAQAGVLRDGTEPFIRASKDDEAVWIESEQQRVLWRPQRGHAFGWISKIARHNTLATLRRYAEEYHTDIAADWHGRGALLDHFFDDQATPELFSLASQAEQGDFISEAWDVSTRVEGETAEGETAEGETALLTARRDGGVWVDGEFRAITVQKRLHLRAGDDALRVEYSFANPSNNALEVWWGCEWNFTLSGHELPERHYHEAEGGARRSLEEIARFENVTHPIVGDRWKKLWIEWEWSEPVGLWHVPLYTFSQKEGGATETTYQQSAFVFHSRLQLPARGKYSLELMVRLTARHSGERE